jgi:hypothetical protein
MATPNYEINYEDQRFKDIETGKQTALNNIDTTYGEMIGNADQYYQSQIDAAQQWADKQSQLQQEKTDFAIEQVQQQKDQAHKDYLKEQSGAYVDWQKQSNQYGANAEAMAAQGMAGSGYSESSQVAMYNTYQNRVATARESYNRAVLNYDNAIKDAQLQNNALLAEIAYNTLQTQLELSLQGFQYKNDLVISQTNKKLDVENQYYNRYQDVLAQINKENALAEQVRQYNESLLEEQRQYNESLLEEQRQFDATQKLKQEQASAESAMYADLLKALQQESVTPSQNNNAVAPQTVAEIQAEAGEPNTGSFKDSVANKHTENTVYIDGVGEMPWEKLFEFVKAGQVKQSKDKNGKLKYTWVRDKAPVADEEEGGTGEDKDGNSGQPMFIKNHGSVSITKETFPMTITNENGKKQKINVPIWKTADGKMWIFHPVAKEYVAYNTAYGNLTSAYK